MRFSSFFIFVLSLFSFGNLIAAPRETCDDAVPAVLGTNHVPETTSLQYWYSFTMPSEGNKKLIITSATNGWIQIYNNINCTNLSWHSFHDYGNGVVVDLAPNQTILINWNFSLGDFDWNLALGDIATGDNPPFADIAVLGQNHLLSSQKGHYWYKFTMPVGARKHLVANSGNNALVTIWRKPFNGILSPARSGTGAVTSVFPDPGEEVFIQWFNKDGVSFDWDLSIEDGVLGEDCTLPILSVEGANTVAPLYENLGSHWFLFTMPNVTKKVLMTLSNNGYFNVYNSCGDVLARMNSNKIVIPDLSPGQTILISISGQHDAIDLNISLEDLESGDICQLAKQANEGSNNLTLHRQVNSWYKYTTPNTPGKRLVISSASSAKVSLYRNTCESLINAGSETGSIKLDNLPANEAILIKWYNTNNDESFTWNLSVDDGALGEKCSTALTASLGDNLFPITSESKWIYYKFTMPNSANKKLVITSNPNNGFVLFNNKCDFNSPLAYGLPGITVGTGLLPGQEITIASYSMNGGNFTWNLSIQDLQDGDMCALAVQANEGVNQLSNTNGSYWYTFTMPDLSNKKLIITSESNNPITIYKKNCPNLNQIGYGNGKVIISDILPLTQISIKWDLPVGTNFSWNLEVEDPAPGDNYLTATLASEGINYLPHGNGTKYWYKFTMPDTPGKKLVITSPQWGYPEIYTTALASIETSNSNLPVTIVASKLTPGQQVFLSWDVSSYNDFDWNLSVEDIEQGDNCSLAKEAKMGSNEVPAGHPAEYWYTFKMPDESGKRLVITSDTQNYIYVFASCSNPDNSNWISSRYGSVSAKLEPNQQVYLRWSNFNGQGFSWNLAIDDEELGLNCSNAHVATEGMNIVSDVPLTDNFIWYSFTMPNESGKKLVISSSSLNAVAFHYVSCDNVFSYDQGNVGGLNFRYPLLPNQQVFIAWNVYDKSSFTWNLSVEDLEIGDACSTPQTPIIGNNEVPAFTTTREYWYSYQMPDLPNKKLVIKSSSKQTILVNTGDCNQLNFFDYNYDGNIVVTGLKPNEKVYIDWYTSGDFSWTLELADELPGESCINPLQAVSGKNSTTQAPHWFTYTIPKDGSYTVSSVGLTNTDTYLSIYDGCNGALLAQNDDFKALQSDVKLTDLQEGEIIYIEWDNNHTNNSAEGFTWNISFIKEDQTITFNALESKKYGDSLFSLNATSSSALALTYASSDSDVATISGNTVTVVGSGTAIITASQEGNEFYKPASPVTQTLTVNKADQSITFNQISDITLSDKQFELNAISTSTLPVSYLTSSDKITIDGNKVNLLKPGSVSIEANQKGNTNYNPAPKINQAFCINPPKPSISVSQNLGTIVLISSVNEGNQWYKDNVLLSGATHETLEVTKNGAYTVVSTIDECAGATSDAMPVVITGDITSNDRIKIYPNPVLNDLIIDTDSDQYSSIKIMDLLGRTTHHTEGKGKIQLNLSDLSSGSYIIHVQNQDLSITRKLIKK